EDQTYAELAARLPRKRTRVGTPDGDGVVIDTQILTQLVLVQLDADGRQVAVPVEHLTEPAGPAPAPGAAGERREPPARARPGRPVGDGRDGRPAPARRPRPPGPPPEATPAAEAVAVAGQTGVPGGDVGSAPPSASRAGDGTTSD